MPLVHQLLSLALVTAPSGPIAPQARTIDDGAAIVEVGRDTEPRGSRGLVTPADAEETAVALGDTSGDTSTSGDTTPATEASGPAVPDPSSGLTNPAEELGFDADPVYLGCGQRVPACENLNTVGVIAGGTGVALIAASTALLLTPDQVIDEEPAYVRDYARPGTTLLALGIGLATTGLLMVLTAARASHTRRRGPRKRLPSPARSIAARGAR